MESSPQPRLKRSNLEQFPTLLPFPIVHFQLVFMLVSAIYRLLSLPISYNGTPPQFPIQFFGSFSRRIRVRMTHNAPVEDGGGNPERRYTRATARRWCGGRAGSGAGREYLLRRWPPPPVVPRATSQRLVPTAPVRFPARRLVSLRGFVREISIGIVVIWKTRPGISIQRSP